MKYFLKFVLISCACYTKNTHILVDTCLKWRQKMLSGCYFAQKKDGSNYYRSSITYKNKHISLGSFSTEKEAHHAYLYAQKLLSSDKKLIQYRKLSRFNSHL